MSQESEVSSQDLPASKIIPVIALAAAKLFAQRVSHGVFPFREWRNEEAISVARG